MYPKHLAYSILFTLCIISTSCDCFQGTSNPEPTSRPGSGVAIAPQPVAQESSTDTKAPQHASLKEALEAWETQKGNLEKDLKKAKKGTTPQGASLQRSNTEVAKAFATLEAVHTQSQQSLQQKKSDLEAQIASAASSKDKKALEKQLKSVNKELKKKGEEHTQRTKKQTELQRACTGLVSADAQSTKQTPQKRSTLESAKAWLWGKFRRSSGKLPVKSISAPELPIQPVEQKRQPQLVTPQPSRQEIDATYELCELERLAKKTGSASKENIQVLLERSLSAMRAVGVIAIQEPPQEREEGKLATQEPQKKQEGDWRTQAWLDVDKYVGEVLAKAFICYGVEDIAKDSPKDMVPTQSLSDAKSLLLQARQLHRARTAYMSQKGNKLAIEPAKDGPFIQAIQDGITVLEELIQKLPSLTAAANAASSASPKEEDMPSIPALISTGNPEAVAPTSTPQAAAKATPPSPTGAQVPDVPPLTPPVDLATLAVSGMDIAVVVSPRTLDTTAISLMLHKRINKPVASEEDAQALLAAVVAADNVLQKATTTQNTDQTLQSGLHKSLETGIHQAKAKIYAYYVKDNSTYNIEAAYKAWKVDPKKNYKTWHTAIQGILTGTTPKDKEGRLQQAAALYHACQESLQQKSSLTKKQQKGIDDFCQEAQAQEMELLKGIAPPAWAEEHSAPSTPLVGDSDISISETALAEQG